MIFRIGDRAPGFRSFLVSGNFLVSFLLDSHIAFFVATFLIVIQGTDCISKYLISFVYSDFRRNYNRWKRSRCWYPSFSAAKGRPFAIVFLNLKHLIAFSAYQWISRYVVLKSALQLDWEAGQILLILGMLVSSSLGGSLWLKVPYHFHAVYCEYYAKEFLIRIEFCHFMVCTLNKI